MRPLTVERRALLPGGIERVSVRMTSGDLEVVEFPEVQARTTPATVSATEERDDSGATTEIHFRGHAIVFDQLSDDLGGFREMIDRGALRKVMGTNPDVRADAQHLTWQILGRTTAKTLDLTVDPRGLEFVARSAPTTFAQDLRLLVDRGDVNQASFMFTTSRDRWEEDENGNLLRTVLELDELFAVSIVTFPAYPQTNVASVRGNPSSPEETTPQPGSPDGGEQLGGADGDRSTDEGEGRAERIASFRTSAGRYVSTARSKTHQIGVTD